MGNRVRRKLQRHINLPLRLTILFLSVTLLFLLLLFRLAQMQLVNYDFYHKKLTASTTYTIKTGSRRGKIYDAKGIALVDNNERSVITFTRSITMSTQEIRDLAQKLSQYVTFSDANVSTRDKKDYYLADNDHYQKIIDALPKSKKVDLFGNSLSQATIYSNAVKAVPDSAINYSESELGIIHAFTEMNASQNFSTVNVTTSPLTAEQISNVDAHAKELPGVKVAKTWDRVVHASTLSDIIGRISSEKSGLPEDEAKSYLSKGYSPNDRVGTSYLEKAYESDLQGKHQVRTVKVDRNNEVISNKLTQTAEPGNSLKLTLNMDFQNKVESILQNYLTSEIGNGAAVNSDGLYAVALEPSTGKVLALAGYKHNVGTNEVEEDNIGTINNVMTPGSVVKGATITSGWENKVLSGDEVLYDQEIHGIKSWFTSGYTPISASQALEYSSNTYMVQIAMRMMGQDDGSSSTVSEDVYKSTMDKLRQTYGQYGLGVSTGFDLPESTGYLPKKFDYSETLFESFGQYDNYTPMQLAQYIATVANNGKRVSPHIVDSIYQQTADGNLGEKRSDVSGKVLNEVPISSEDMDIIQQGFYNVVNSNSGYATGTDMRSNVTTISGKTGTAETYTQNAAGTTVKTVNLNAIAYNEDRTIAVAVMYPHVADGDDHTAQKVARDIINQYVSSK